MLKAVADQVAITIRNREQIWSELLSTASHQLRSFLTPVKSCIQCMLSGRFGKINDKQKSRLEAALASVHEQERLITNLLDLVRIVKEKARLKEDFQDLSSIIKDVAQVFEYDAREKDIALDYKLVIDGLKIWLDREKIKQVLTNLIDNAIKFTPPGGLITVSTLEQGEDIGVKVSDTGIGIPGSEKSKIFGEFYQVDTPPPRRADDGGIGLSIAKNYVQLHGGKIWVESEKGKGSAFIFTLPKVRGKMGDEKQNINYRR
jgi:signal transduction histidine kinase